MTNDFHLKSILSFEESQHSIIQKKESADKKNQSKVIQIRHENTDLGEDNTPSDKSEHVEKTRKLEE